MRRSLHVAVDPIRTWEGWCIKGAPAVRPVLFPRVFGQFQSWNRPWEGCVGRANLEPPFLAQHWFAPVSALQARDQGALLIASPAANAYLDMKYDESTPIGLTWAGFTDVRDAYEWDPVSQGLVEGDIVGLEAPLWTETVDSLDDIEFMVFPRLLGYAEIGWSRREDRGWDEYRVRLADHGRRLAARNVSFFQSPLVDWPAPLSP